MQLIQEMVKDFEGRGENVVKVKTLNTESLSDFFSLANWMCKIAEDFSPRLPYLWVEKKEIKEKGKGGKYTYNVRKIHTHYKAVYKQSMHKELRDF